MTNEINTEADLAELQKQMDEKAVKLMRDYGPFCAALAHWDHEGEARVVWYDTSGTSQLLQVHHLAKKYGLAALAAKSLKLLQRIDGQVAGALSKAA